MDQVKIPDIYSGNWANCNSGNVALEGMVRRFKGRHVSAADDDKFARSGGKYVDGIVDAQTLLDLSSAWKNYYPVYSKHKSRPTILLGDAIVDPYLDEVVALWEIGSGTSMPPSYTDAVNRNVLRLAGLSETSKTQKDLLKAWKVRETDSHWGSASGKPQTNYRITEGGADELGSMSFNQVLFQFRYSRKPLRVHRDFNYNYFDPRENMLGFAVHTSAFSKGDATSFNSAGPLYEAFAKRSMADSYSTDQGLTGYKHCTDQVTCTAATVHSLNALKKDDDYELLARAVLRYNAGSYGNQNISWPDLLCTKLYCKGCGMEYSMNIRNVRLGLPYRQYIWIGGTNPIDKDTEPPFVDEDPLHPNPENIDPDAGQNWCFAFGEQEWMSKKVWQTIKTNAAPYDENGDPKSRSGNIGCP